MSGRCFPGILLTPGPIGCRSSPSPGGSWREPSSPCWSVFASGGKVRHTLLKSADISSMHDALTDLLGRRRDIISDHEFRDRDTLGHLEALKEVSEQISAWQA